MEPDQYDLPQRLLKLESEVTGLKNLLLYFQEKQKILDKHDEQLSLLREDITEVTQILKSNAMIRNILVAVLTTSITTLAAVVLKWIISGDLS
jgi:hypothetical protein